MIAMRDNIIIRDNKVGLDAFLFGLYIALTPAYQILNLSGTGTINKYLGMIVVAAILFRMFLRQSKFEKRLINLILPMLFYFIISIVWSISFSNTLSEIVTLLNYVIFWMVCSNRGWSAKEKKLICIMAIVSGVIFSYSIILQQLDGVRRSTLLLSDTEKEADQNGLGINMAYVFMISLHYFFTSNKKTCKIISMLLCIIYFVTIICTGSRGALLALFVAIMFYTYSFTQYYKKRKLGTKILLVLSGAVIAYLILTQSFIINDQTLMRYVDEELLFNTGGSGRLTIWGKYINILLSNPLYIIIGFGYGTTYAANTYVTGNMYPPAVHNTYLYLLICAGLIGLTLCVAFFAKVLLTARRNKDLLSSSCVLIALCAMLTLDLFTNKGIWNIFIFAQMGLGVDALQKQQNVVKDCTQ